MCGIFGVMTNANIGFTQTQLDILGQALIVNQFRGTDSTGIFAVNNKNETALHKVVGGPSAFFASQGWEDMKKALWNNGRIAIGHGRAATRGTVSVENAHPFAKEFPTGEKLKLVHNGTLEPVQDLEDFNKFQVDSEWIAEMLVRHGPEALSKIRGAMALVWYNEQEKTINFFRNSQRPLHFCTYLPEAGSQTFIVASEAAAVRFLGDRNGLKSTDDKADCFYFTPMKHFALHLDDLFGEWLSVKEIKEPPERKVSYYSRNNPYGFWDRDDEDYSAWNQRYLDQQSTVKDVRGQMSDVRRLQDGIFKKVLFVKRADGKYNRETHHQDGTITIDLEVEPYSFGLKTMERILERFPTPNDPEQWWVKQEWVSSVGNPYYTRMKAYAVEEDKKKKRRQTIQHNLYEDIEVVEDWEFLPKIFAEEFKGKNKELTKLYAPIGVTYLRPGRQIRWHSRSGANATKTTRHSAVISKWGGGVLDKYENSIDGEIGIGDVVEVEILGIETTEYDGERLFRAYGSRNVGGAMDIHIDVCFFIAPDDDLGIKILSASDLLTLPRYRGKIEQIALTSKTRYEQAGTYACAFLTDVKAVA